MKALTIALIGNPNCGKTTLFNTLTGAQQKVGNWPGVTVDRKSGCFHWRDTRVTVIDLPGTYSLVSLAENLALDEKLVADFLLSESVDAIVNIVDGTSLERHLYLTTQLRDLNIPVMVAVNMLDILEKQGAHIHYDAMSAALNCPVLPISASQATGLDKLKNQILQLPEQAALFTGFTWPKPITEGQQIIATLINTHYPELSTQKAIYGVRLLEGDSYLQSKLQATHQQQVQRVRETISAQGEDADSIIADQRYGWIHQQMKVWMQRGDKTRTAVSATLDKVLLNKYLGIPCFLSIMYLLFLFAINIGGAFQDFFDIASDTLFVQAFAHWLTQIGAPASAVAILADGAGRGINTTVTFIPVLAAMFCGLAFLEASGYMARAAFVMDRMMQALGLPGKSFVPLVIGFGCNVPSILATRTLENHRDRVLTCLMSPFMSCSARLTIFAVFTTAFFPVGGHNVVFALYLIGIVLALATGFILRKTLLHGRPAPLIMELPSYRWPTARALLTSTWLRLKAFLWRAGKVIVPLCVIIGAMNSLAYDGEFVLTQQPQQSLLADAGRYLTPLFAPMGVHQDNWPATVGLITGTMAKEVVVATLNTLYSSIGHLSTVGEQFSVWQGLHEAAMSVVENLKALPEALTNPVLASAPEQGMRDEVYGVMAKYFVSNAAAFAYLLFILLYIPCVSTMAVIARELNRGWAWFSVLWSLALAYGMATLFYQVATFSEHPASSEVWLAVIPTLFAGVVYTMKRYARVSKITPLSLQQEG